MSWPVPQPGLVIRYSYLWEREARAGREEGVKDRPCAIVLALLRTGEKPVVRVLPITHSAPTDTADALEIPTPTKKRLGLDGERSWIVLTEGNDFVWPGPDLRPLVTGNLSSVAYGFLPPKFMKLLSARLAQRFRERRHAPVVRND